MAQSKSKTRNSSRTRTKASTKTKPAAKAEKPAETGVTPTGQHLDESIQVQPTGPTPQ